MEDEDGGWRMDREELDGPAVSALGVRSRWLSNVGRLSDGLIRKAC
jgi:hypothetical protein